MSRGRVAVVGAAIGLAASTITLVLGPAYLRPLPMWGKVALAVACSCVIAAVAIIGRRRSTPLSR